MTSWTTISNSALAVGGIPSSTTVTALRDNPSALAESSTGAPVMVSGWHPVDKITIGDGKAGVIYDAALDGTVASIITPDFEDGYEYRIIAEGLSHNNGINNRSLRLGLTIDGTTYVEASIGNNTGTAAWGLDADLLMPRLSKTSFFVRLIAHVETTLSSADDFNLAFTSSGKVAKARLIYSGGSIDAGKVWLFRRREYASLP